MPVVGFLLSRCSLKEFLILFQHGVLLVLFWNFLILRFPDKVKHEINPYGYNDSDSMLDANSQVPRIGLPFPRMNSVVVVTAKVRLEKAKNQIDQLHHHEQFGKNNATLRKFTVQARNHSENSNTDKG